MTPMYRRRLPILVTLLATTLILAGCSRGQSVNPLIPTQTSEAGTPVLTPTLVEARAPCEDGVMLIGDLPAIDAEWLRQLEPQNKQALEWHDDAQLVQLRVSCALFGSGFRTQPSYFSAQALAILAADTRESRPVNLDPEKVESLPKDQISFERIYQSLKDADLTDELRLDPSTGIDIRINSEQAPFGPASAPLGAVIAHVSVEQAGQVKDLFIDEQSGEIYSFEQPQ